jgi:PEP-CTERM motif
MISSTTSRHQGKYSMGGHLEVPLFLHTSGFYLLAPGDHTFSWDINFANGSAESGCMVPEPTTLALLGPALVGMIAVARKRQHAFRTTRPD